MILNTLTPVYYPNWIGNRQVFVGTGTGPATYNQTTGDVLSVSFTPFNIDGVLGVALTADLKYIGIPAPITVGKSGGWTIFWYNFVATSGGTPAWTPLANNSTALAAEQIQLSVLGGP